MRKHLAVVVALATAAMALCAAFPGVASAHEQRDIAGKFHLVVGFINEPAIANQPNGIDLTITDIASKQPIEGADKTLKAQIIYGGSTEDVTLRGRFGQPGKYTADVIPTKSGTWKFHFTGAINGTNVDEIFESGPGRFNDVQAQDTLQFPVKVAAPLDVANQASAAQSTADSAKSTARTGVVLGVAGIVVGGVGLLAGLAGLGYGLTARRQQRETAGGTSLPRTA